MQIFLCDTPIVVILSDIRNFLAEIIMGGEVNKTERKNEMWEKYMNFYRKREIKWKNH